ncbi:MAG: DUF3822 family protein [Lentimicrobium sp.]|nr:DUF3822 family protein [Lentimicrobium sp.]
MLGDHIKKVSSYDRLFDQAHTRQYNLSIRLNPDGLSFSVYSIPHKKYIALESFRFPETFQMHGGALAISVYLDQIAKTIDEKSWLLSEFKNRIVIYNTKIYTLIPEPLFNAHKIITYLGFVHKIGDGDTVLTSKFQTPDSRIVFGINSTIYKEINSWFNNPALIHHAGALIESVLPAFKHSDTGNPVFLNITNKLIDIIVLRNNNLNFVNSFEWRASTDIVYFLLFVLDQLSMNPGKVNVYLSGEIDENDENHQLLSKYIRNLEFLSHNEPHTRGYALELIASHKYYELLNPALCE